MRIVTLILTQSTLDLDGKSVLIKGHPYAHPYADRYSASAAKPQKYLKNYKHGLVLAVFDRSFYVRCAQHVFCIGVASLGRGPLHLLIESEHDVLPLKLVSGMSIKLTIHFMQDSPMCHSSVSWSE